MNDVMSVNESNLAGGPRPLVSYPRAVHRLSWALAVTVFPLIWVGGLVTTTKAGMAVPDWPGTYGYNMFLYPWTTWFFGPWDLFIEHGHRLLGSLAGIWCLALVALAWSRSVPRAVWWLSVSALILVVIQGTLGGIRVLQIDREVAKLHGCFGQAFFAFVALMIVVTSRWWVRVGQANFWLGGRTGLRDSSEPAQAGAAGAKLGANAEVESGVSSVGVPDRSTWVAMLGRLRVSRNLALAVFILAFGQLYLGASLRHIPESGTPGHYRLLLWFHLIGAVSVMVAALWLLWKSPGPVPGLHVGRWLLAGLVLGQISLGLGTWVVKFGFPHGFAETTLAQQHLIVNDAYMQVMVVTGHVAIGSLILATAAFLVARLWRAEHGLRALMLGEPSNHPIESWNAPSVG